MVVNRIYFYRRALLLAMLGLLAMTVGARETHPFEQGVSGRSQQNTIRWHRPFPVTAEPAAGEPIAIPVIGVEASELRDGFEAKRVGHVHHAIDIFAPRGTPVISAVDGTIGKIFESSSGGHTVYVIDRNRQFVYYYAHLDSYAPGLLAGRRVREGEIIGYVGTTGNAAASSPHLHFAIEQLDASLRWWKGTPVNPYPLLARRGVSYEMR